MTCTKTFRPGLMGQAGARFAVATICILLIASTTRAQTAELRLVARSTPSGSDVTTGLPASEAHFGMGATFYIEIWTQTTHTNGLSSVSLDIAYNASLAHAVTITHTSLFSALTHGTFDNGAGIVNDLSGSHLGPCTDAIGVTPSWARVAFVQMTAVASSGVLFVQSGPTGSPIYETDVCGIGNIIPAFGEAAIGLGDTNIPTVSEWGLLALALSFTIAASILIGRHPAST